jgi:hypothetical protein
MEKDYVFAVPSDSNFKKISQEVHIPDYFFKNIIKKERPIIMIKNFII